MKNVRIAVAIMNSPFGQIEHNLNQIAALAKEASQKKAALICFPEMNITGYHNGQDIYNIAQPIPGPVTEQISFLSKSYQITIISGLAETDSEKIFMTQIISKPDGSISKYRKIHPGPSEFNISAGDSIIIEKEQWGTYGVQLCYDSHFPELSTIMAIQGVDMIFIPHASPHGTSENKYNSWMRHLTARAYDNSVYIVACNQTGKNHKGLTFPGIALVIDPSGYVVEKMVKDKEGLLFVDIKSDCLTNVRNHRMKYFLPNRRPEIYRSMIV